MIDSSGPYQSRFFNFVVRQSRRLADQSGQTWRRLKLAAAWGVQLGLYPVYVLFQTTRLLGQQIQRGVQSVMPGLRSAPIQPPSETVSLPPPDPDASIRQILQAVQALALPTGSAPKAQADLQSFRGFGAIAPASAGITPSAKIRGVASQIEGRSLVLVSDRNDILNILSPGQQHQLRARIAWEVAHYWQQWRQWRFLQRSMIQPLSGSDDIAPALPPVRWLHHVMAWVQTSPIAIALNFFQESALVVWTAPTGNQSGLPINPEGALVLTVPTELDYVLARLEAGDISPILDWMGETVQRGQLALRQIPSGLSQHIGATLVDDAAGRSTRLLRIIQAAIAYFFGARRSPEQLAAPSIALPDGLVAPAQSNSREAIAPATEPTTFPQAWWSRLLAWIQSQKPFSSALALREAETTGSETVFPELSHATPASGSPAYPAVHPIAAAIAALNLPQVESSVPALATNLNAHAPLANPSISASPAWAASTREQRVEPTVFQSPAFATTTTWIEADATAVGYVKHPLEQLLEWLDVGMFWLEEQILRLSRWMKQIRANWLNNRR